MGGSNELAPICLFVYNRSWHTKQTVEALQKNKLARNHGVSLILEKVESHVGM